MLRTALYEKFVSEMKAGGLRQLFEEKPVLLRLISTIVRQWIETSREFIQRLDADLALYSQRCTGRWAGRGHSD